MPITFSSHQSITDASKNNYYKVYAADVGYGNYTTKFTRENTGFFAGESTNTIEKTLDSTKYNELSWRGYIRLGNNFTLSDIIKGLGRFIQPESNEHDFDRSASYRFNNHVKICATSQFTSTRDNRGIRYLPNKRNPVSIDLYPFRTLMNLNLKGTFGSYSKALKADIGKESANQLAMYLGRKESVYLDMDGNFRNMSNSSYTHPPELTYHNGYDMAFQNEHPFDSTYRRKVANFQYYGVNQETIIYEDDPNAANVWMNRQLGTTNKLYKVNSVEEEFYQEENVYSELLEKYFENVDTENLTFEYKGITYHLDGSIIYNENNEEVLGIELDNGSIFSFNYEKYIAYGLKDKTKDDIDKFKNYIKTRTPSPTFNSKYYMLHWEYVEDYYDDSGGEGGGGNDGGM